MTLKSSVTLKQLKPQTLLAMIVANEAYSSIGSELFVTSGDDSQHSPTSLHYKGLAFDCRIRNLTPEDLDKVLSRIRTKLTTEYDVIRESDHIHIEYDPKK